MQPFRPDLDLRRCAIERESVINTVQKFEFSVARTYKLVVYGHFERLGAAHPPLQDSANNQPQQNIAKLHFLSRFGRIFGNLFLLSLNSEFFHTTCYLTLLLFCVHWLVLLVHFHYPFRNAL
jgi:hypothetical protein